MTKAASLALALTLGSCSVMPPESPPASTTPVGLACIDSDRVAGRRGAGAGAIDFEMSNGVVFRNHFQGACPGIERLGSMLAVAVVSGGEGGRLCRGDRIRIFDPVEVRAVGIPAQPSCVLGGFTQVSRPTHR